MKKRKLKPRFDAEMTQEEVAEKLGLHPDTVKRIEQRAKRKLRESKLADYIGDLV